MSICYIIGAGDFSSLRTEPQKGDLVIAADGGYNHLKKENITPDIAIGDFDSLGEIPVGCEVIKLNPVKDITDMHAATEIGIARGYTSFQLYGACGGRFDHTFANVQLAALMAEKGFEISIIDGDKTISAISNGELKFSKRNSGYISVFSHSDLSTGVTISGLRYTLDGAELKNSFPLGVSNEFIGTDASVSVEKGTLIVIY